jgi:hypothetical protein
MTDVLIVIGVLAIEFLVLIIIDKIVWPAVKGVFSITEAAIGGF